MRSLRDTTIGRAISAWPSGGRAPQPRKYVFHYEHVLGTSLELQVVADSEADARRAESEALDEVDRLEPILSGWSSTSELARWQATQGDDMPVSPELADVLEAAEWWRILTGGAFNPAAQQVVESLRDGVAPVNVSGPHWMVDRVHGSARRFSPHAVSLDAIAKGYIVSRAAKCARAAAGVSDVLLNVGGDLQHFGAAHVVVGIADPAAPAENEAHVAMVRIENEALATSGGYRRGFIVAGQRVSHIVDPRTGAPASRIASASVIAPECATADALSTAFSVMSPDESVALADTLPGIACLLVEPDGTITTNAAWNDRAVPTPHDTNSQGYSHAR